MTGAVPDLLPRNAAEALDEAAASSPVTLVHGPPGFGLADLLRTWHHAAHGPDALFAEVSADAVVPDLAGLGAQGGDVVVVPEAARWCPNELTALAAAALEAGVRLVAHSNEVELLNPPANVVVLEARDLGHDRAATAGFLPPALDTPDNAECIWQATMGWPGLVRTAARSLGSGAHHATTDCEVAAYAVREELRRLLLPWLPDAWWPMLTYLCFGDGATMDELEDVPGAGGSAVVGAALHHRLVEVRDEGGAVAVFLPVELRKLVHDEVRTAGGNAVADAFRTVARVRSASGTLDCGIEAAYQLRDWDLCGEIMHRWTKELIYGRYTEFTAKVMRQMPEEVIRRHPAVGHRAELHGLLPVGATPLAFPTTEVGIQSALRTGDAAHTLHPTLMAISARRIYGRMADARRIALDAAPMAFAACRFDHSGARDVSTMWHLQAGMACHLYGDEINARRLYRIGWADEQYDALGFAGRDLAAKSAVLSAVRGDLDDARTWLAAAQSYPEATGWVMPLVESGPRLAARALALDELQPATGTDPHGTADVFARDEMWIFALWIAVQSMLVAGMADGALDLIEDAVATHPHNAHGDGVHPRLLASLRAEAHLALGQGTQAIASLSELDDEDSATAAIRGRLRLLGGDPGLAREVAQAHAGNRQVWPRSRRELLLVQAAAEAELGMLEDADRSLRHALEGAATRNDRRLVTTLPMTARDLLADRVRGAGEMLERVDSGDRIDVYPDRVSLVDLTERESVVLRELARGLKQHEIAAALYVSLNTVKSQLRSLYRKLGVASRAEAIARATELGLIDID